MSVHFNSHNIKDLYIDNINGVETASTKIKEAWFNGHMVYGPGTGAKIISAAITYVAAYDIPAQRSRKCLTTIFEDKSASICIFDDVFPTAADIRSNVFNDLEYTSEYNSAFYNSNNIWVPAQAENRDKSLRYYRPLGTAVQSLLKSSLSIGWKWDDGQLTVYTTHVYDVTVVNGLLTIKDKSGNILLETR